MGHFCPADSAGPDRVPSGPKHPDRSIFSIRGRHPTQLS